MDDSKDTKDKSSSRKRIVETGNELKKALQAWDDLSAQPLAPPADEQRLSDVKDLLKQIKTQLEKLK
jgi:hypothetical protein